MSRGLSSTTIAALAADNLNLCTLVQLDFTTAIRITDYDRDISAFSTTFTASGHLLSIDQVSESSALKVNATKLVLSAVEQTYVSLFLNNAYIDVRARIWKAALDASDAIQGDAILVFDGRITGYDIEDRNSQSLINIYLASHWKDFEKKSGRKTNHNMQQLHFPGDDGFEFASAAVKDIKWGKK